MNITVYCGSNPGSHPEFSSASKELGLWLGQNGHTLVYGGGRNGLMGDLARSTLQSGGKVIGVIPQIIKNFEQELAGLSQVHHVETMFERKNKMIDLADAFIAMPGGVGTLEEISEILSLKRVGLIHQPCIIYNVQGYYQSFIQFLDEMVYQEFLDREIRQSYFVANNIEEISKKLVNFS